MATFYQPPPDPEQILRDLAKYVAALKQAEVTITINVSPTECSTSVYDRRNEAVRRAALDEVARLDQELFPEQYGRDERSHEAD